MSYDKDGHRYDLPVFVVQSPDSFKKSNIKSQFRVKQIKVRLILKIDETSALGGYE